MLATEVKAIVKDAYADVAIAKVSHMHALSGCDRSSLETMLMNPALTASLVGLLGEDALITPRLGGLGQSGGVPKKKAIQSDRPPSSST